MKIEMTKENITRLINILIQEEQKESTGLKDRYLNEIFVGDSVNYPVRQGSCMWMADGIVLGQKNGKLCVKITDVYSEERVAYVCALERVTKIPNSYLDLV